MILKSNCQKCNGEIEFDDYLINTEVTCPICNNTTLILTPERKKRVEEDQKAFEDAQLILKQKQDEYNRTLVNVYDNKWFPVGIVITALSILGILILSGDGISGFDKTIIFITSMVGLIIGHLQFIIATLNVMQHNQKAGLLHQIDSQLK
jgi:uncharacterized protein YbaR (Trm112 family)